MKTQLSSLFLVASLSILAVACDAEDDPIVDERSAEFDASPDAIGGERGDHARHGKRGKRGEHMAQRLCSELECSDEQLTQVTELFTAERRERDPDAREAAHRETNQKIADAFAADEFDPSVLERAKGEHMGEGHEDRMIEMATELHGILTPTQRATLADRVESHGPMFFGRHGKGHHGERGHHAKRGHHGPGHEGSHPGPEGRAERDPAHPANKLAKKVDHLCEVVTCTEDQRTQLTATFEGVREEHRAAREERAANKPDFGPIAALFRAETFDAEAMRATMRAGKAEHEARMVEHSKAFGTVVAEIHDILTPEQRRLVADAIAEHGVRGLMGKGPRGGKRRE